MQQHFLSFVIWYTVCMAAVFDSTSADFYNVPGCRVLEDEELNVSVRCTEFNISYTPHLLPKNTKSLQLYKVKNLVTYMPLAPKLSMLTKLDLPSNEIRNISEVMFEGLENILFLSLKNNVLRHIPLDAFINTLKLETVDLSENFLFDLQFVSPSLGCLKNLKHLSVKGNYMLKKIKDNDLVALNESFLVSLDISSCRLSVIEQKAFSPLKSLASLDISRNPLDEQGLYNISFSLRKDHLKGLFVNEMINVPYFSCRFLRWLQLSQIESLYISGNKLLCFPQGNYKQLKILEIGQSNILKLFSHSFSGMPDLEFLKINEHKLEGIDQEFKTNIKLKHLDLSNFIGMKSFVSFRIADYAFENQKQLLFLKLANLPIKTDIQRYSLYGLRNLKYLSFYKGLIPSIECHAFETLNNLEYLDFSHNLINEILNCSFHGLLNVKIVNLANNLITFINGGHPFKNTPKLEVLNLISNKISVLTAGLFQNLNNIAVILLSDNLITPWNSPLLLKSSNSTTLMLKNNAITHFSEGMWDDISNLGAMDFSGNPIDCSHCSSLKLQEWMNNTTSVVKNINKIGAYVCDNPEFLQGEEILSANITSSTLHCLSDEENAVKIWIILLFFSVCIILILSFVWYRWSWNIKYGIFMLRMNAKKYKHRVDSRRYAFDAYVFHCDNDIHWIRTHLLPALENEEPKLRLCLLDRNFDAGTRILENLTSAIDNSRSTVIVLSHECLKSSWYSYNIQTAQNMLLERNGNGLIIIFLENIAKDKLGKDLQYVFRTRTCIWWTEDTVGQKLFWKRLRLAIMRPTDRGISTHIT